MEILVGNHLGNCDALGKVRRRKEDPDGPNPFVDPTEWNRFLDYGRSWSATSCGRTPPTDTHAAAFAAGHDEKS